MTGLYKSTTAGSVPAPSSPALSHIPMMGPPRSEEEPRSDERNPSLQGKRVVIVEDEGITQMLLRRALTRAGLNVVGSASNGKAGVEAVLAERPDLVLMDINMPVMNGLQAAERILEEYPVCIVMLTAYALDEYREQAQRIGACGYILKPVVADTLVRSLSGAYGVFLKKSVPPEIQS